MKQPQSPASEIDISIRRFALLSGLILFLMTLCAVYSEMFVRGSLVVADDPLRTVGNIQTHQLLFRTGIIGYLSAAILDILVAWTLFLFLKPVAPQLALLAAWVRVSYAVVFIAATGFLVNAVSLVPANGSLPNGIPEQLVSQVMYSLSSFGNLWSIGLVLFGTHLVVLGAAIFRSGFVPRLLGLVLIIAGLGYIADFVLNLLLPGLPLQLAMVVGWGELLFMIWLLTKGRSITVAQTA